ncbi:hypothetical protein GYMLUDRAFT_253253 [Collybiopsis luxurians FD-317 M1]|uniref:Uncharacterized protein n=1 Tax=Collybiopsis luxurians FD-317 M1 TaxID=944289 RepID=A0A0D0BXA8_9AGAR|nr:hypothetical protein GYMLUDRAFT_253253 [Collybiopsis luxurians FD-317 M1]
MALSSKARLRSLRPDHAKPVHHSLLVSKAVRFKLLLIRSVISVSIPANTQVHASSTSTSRTNSNFPVPYLPNMRSLDDVGYVSGLRSGPNELYFSSSSRIGIDSSKYYKPIYGRKFHPCAVRGRLVGLYEFCWQIAIASVSGSTVERCCIFLLVISNRLRCAPRCRQTIFLAMLGFDCAPTTIPLNSPAACSLSAYFETPICALCSRDKDSHVFLMQGSFGKLLPRRLGRNVYLGHSSQFQHPKMTYCTATCAHSSPVRPQPPLTMTTRTSTLL